MCAKIRTVPGLTFDDVLLIPRRSSIASRSSVDTRARLTRRLALNMPIISANMDTVTESAMAIAMARAGGLGIIHRFMTVDRQAAEVARVKRAESYVVESPETISASATVGEAKARMKTERLGGMLVLDESGALLGMVTTRDTLLAPDPQARVTTVMTLREKLITAPIDTDLKSARQILHEHRIEKLPLVDQQGHLHGLITMQDIVKIERHPQATKDPKGHLRVGAAIGVHPDDVERAAACNNAGVDVLVVDVAHGHSDLAIAMIKRIKNKLPAVDLIAGNVATPEGVQDLAAAGADAVKVGVGSGSICITRVVTGFGIPQLTAIMDCASAAHALDLPIVADGGIRTSGDLTKALAAGADAAMIGSLLAGTEESPGASVVRDGQRYKVVRGMASLTANIDRMAVARGGEVDPEDWERVVPEGVEAVVPHRGPVADVLYQLVGGLRSGLSYAGATTIQELQQNAEFIQVTGAGMRESGPHDVETI
jgi:IMP dehydrogenase